MKKILALSAIAALLLGGLTSCAKAPDPANAYLDESPQEIYAKGLTALHKRSYNEAIKRFEALEVQYPYGEETGNAELGLIYAYYQREDYTLATAMADHYIHMHPVGPDLDYAYYMRGISNYYQNLGILERWFSLDLAKRDLVQIETSYSDFNEVVTHFPESEYAPAAHQYMIYLRNILADHEAHIAEYYYERGAYVAAADRASDLVAHFQGAPTVQDGLIIMAKSYHALGLNQQANDAMRVLQLNYPDTPSDIDALRVHLDTKTT